MQVKKGLHFVGPTQKMAHVNVEDEVEEHNISFDLFLDVDNSDHSLSEDELNDCEKKKLLLGMHCCL